MMFRSLVFRVLMFVTLSSPAPTFFFLVGINGKVGAGRIEVCLGAREAWRC